MSPQSTALQTTDMEAKEYELLYSAVAHQSYPEGITKNQKDVLRNKAKKFVVREGLLYYCASSHYLQFMYSLPGNSTEMNCKLYGEEMN